MSSSTSGAAVAAALVAVLLAGAGCAGRSREEPRDAGAGASLTAPNPEGSSAPAATGTKPTVTVPDGPPPTQLQTRDLVVGTGPEATPGKVVSVHYVGVAFSTRKQFDASWDRGEAFSFPLGAGRVIQGWDQGVAGMRVGGRRELVIPPALGYGDRGAGSDIKPGETLVFVVDLLAVR